MEIKKSPKADIETKKGLFMQFGLVFSLVLIWAAFEWKSYDKITTEQITSQAVKIEEDMIIQTAQEAPPPPPPPSQISTEIDVVDDDIEIEDDDISFDVESDEKARIEPAAIVVIEAEETVVEEEIFQVVEESPSFPGGEEALHEFIRRNLSYPVPAQESGIQGRVYIGFVVEKDGGITDVSVLRGIGGGCDEAAVNIVKKLPKWNPGKQRGKAVRCRFSLPISFTLN